MNIPSRSLGSLIYVLPALHLCACATMLPMGDLKHIYLEYMIIIDFPLSFFLAIFAWRFGYLVFWLFLIFGTAWWYLIGLGVRRLVRIAMGQWDENR
jgi:hypothetical protein